MLRQLRENTKTILWIVVVAFLVTIFAFWGMNLDTGKTGQQGKTEIAGSVEGVPIHWRTYINARNEIFNRYASQKGENYVISETERRFLNEQAWEMVISQILTKREIVKANITVTDDELVRFIRRNPHPQLQQTFKTEDGQFDYQAYLAAMADPGADWTQVEQWARALIPEIKLKSLLAAQVCIPEREIIEQYGKDSMQVRAEYVLIPMSGIDTTWVPTDQEIEVLYDEVKEEYIEFERRRVAVIEIKKEPTKADELEIRETLENIREDILAGGDFAEEAKNSSEDYMSAVNGGDLGFFGRGQMVSLFEEAAFSLKKGEISGPVRSEYGYHLIKVEERKTEDGEEKIRARHILIKVKPGYDTIDSLKAYLADVRNAIKTDGFEQAIETMNLTVKEPLAFSKGTFIPEFGYVPDLIDFSFNHAVGKVSDVIEFESFLYFAKILEAIPERVKPLDKIRNVLVDRLARKRAEETTLETTGSIRRQALTSGSLETAALANGFQLQETPLFREAESVPGIGVNTAFSRACHLLLKGELSPPIKGQNEYYLIRVMERVEPDMTRFPEYRQTIVNQMSKELANVLLAGWYDAVRKRAEVVDLRELTIN